MKFNFNITFNINKRVAHKRLIYTNTLGIKSTEINAIINPQAKPVIKNDNNIIDFIYILII